MSKAKKIARLERLANEEGLSASERLARIHEVYAARGIPKYVYSKEEA